MVGWSFLFDLEGGVAGSEAGGYKVIECKQHGIISGFFFPVLLSFT